MKLSKILSEIKILSNGGINDSNSGTYSISGRSPEEVDKYNKTYLKKYSSNLKILDSFLITQDENFLNGFDIERRNGIFYKITPNIHMDVRIGSTEYIGALWSYNVVADYQSFGYFKVESEYITYECRQNPSRSSIKVADLIYNRYKDIRIKINNEIS